MLDRIGNTALVLIVIVIIMVRTDIEEAINVYFDEFRNKGISFSCLRILDYLYF